MNTSNTKTGGNCLNKSSSLLALSIIQRSSMDVLWAVSLIRSLMDEETPLMRFPFCLPLNALYV